jgi:hypothetical protein
LVKKPLNKEEEFDKNDLGDIAAHKASPQANPTTSGRKGR